MPLVEGGVELFDGQVQRHPLPADARGNGMAVRNMAEALFMTVLPLSVYWLAQAEVERSGLA